MHDKSLLHLHIAVLTPADTCPFVTERITFTNFCYYCVLYATKKAAMMSVMTKMIVEVYLLIVIVVISMNEVMC